MLYRCNNFSCRKVVCVCCLSPCGESGLKCCTAVLPLWTCGLSPCGESGLKFAQNVKKERGLSLSPCGESGLKYFIKKHLCRLLLSLPVWGEWIEIFLIQRLSPPGTWSLPVWGEWIEIFSAERLSSVKRSLPVWGEWIEIGGCAGRGKAALCLSPCGESGLK